jgi:host factor-I protein
MRASRLIVKWLVFDPANCSLSSELFDIPGVRGGHDFSGARCFLDVGREDAMENKPAQNIQDSFLNTARKDKGIITIYLLSGVKLTGRIRSFDKYSVVLETNNQEQLIFKHAISTVVMGRQTHDRHHEHRVGEATAAAVNDSTNTGTEV